MAGFIIPFHVEMEDDYTRWLIFKDLEHLYRNPNLLPWLCLGILRVRLCRFMVEAEPPRSIPTRSIGTRVYLAAELSTSGP